MKTLKMLLATLVLGGTIATVQAQNLSLGIYPEPQEVVVSNQLFIPAYGYELRGMENPDEDAAALLFESLPMARSGKKLPLTIQKMKEKRAELQRSGAYQLTIAKKGITIDIVDNRSLFYAAQTLRQLARRDEMGQRTLPLCKITDFPDVAYRGTVEGFYGAPWSHADRIEQLRFYGKVKMNTYIYGPKDDPYHSSPSWREPYPAEQAKQIRELAAEAARNKVDFVWAIHPGKDIQWTLEDSCAILVKFNKMYDLGVRAFAVFFDDIGGEGAKPEKQAGLLNYIQKEFIAKKEGVSPLIMCPTEYNRSWAKTDYLDILGTQLDPAVHIMWTGDRVVADITLEGMEWVNKRIRRPAFVWWNFPVSDYCRDHLLMGPAYGLDSEAAHAMSGFVSNPMEHAEASKVGIFGVAMYAWNAKRYNPTAAWEEACRFIMPHAAVAFRTFTEHNADPGPNGHQYRREESAHIRPQTETFLASYKQNTFREKEANQIASQFTQIATAPTLIYNQNPNKRMIEQINPWLIQFSFLGKTGLASIQMAHAWHQKDLQLTWQRYLEVTALQDSMKQISNTFNQNEFQRGVKVGSLVLSPFITELYRQTGRNLLSTANTPPEELKVSIPSTLTDVEQLKNQPCLEGENSVAYVPLFEVINVEARQSIGLGWEIQKEAQSFKYYLPLSNREGRVFEWSADGKVWFLIEGISSESAQGTFDGIDPKARYIRLRNASDAQMQLYILSFKVTTKEAPRLNEALMMYDHNLATARILQAGEKVEVSCQNTDGLSLFLSGNNESIVSITGFSGDDEKQILYHGYVGYIRFGKAVIDDIEKVEITTISNYPVKIHEIVKE